MPYHSKKTLKSTAQIERQILAQNLKEMLTKKQHKHRIIVLFSIIGGVIWSIMHTLLNFRQDIYVLGLCGAFTLILISGLISTKPIAKIHLKRDFPQYEEIIDNLKEEEDINIESPK